MRKLSFILLLWITCGCEDTLKEGQLNDPVYVFDQIWKEVDRHYSFFEYQDLDWNEVYSNYRPQIHSQSTEQELFDLSSEMLSLLNDPHTNLYSNKGVGGSVDYFAHFPINQLDDIGSYFSYYESYNRSMNYGLIADSEVGYIQIKSFDGESEEYKGFEQLLAWMPNISGLIIDVRSNRGGLISNVESILKKMVRNETIISQYRHRNGTNHTDFSGWMDFKIRPDDSTSLMALPIIVLTNRQCFSACEWFVMGIQSLPNAQIVGDTTGGGSAIPILRELPNGWLLRVSNTQMRLATGEDFQFRGLYPDDATWISDQDAIDSVDSILESAIVDLSLSYIIVPSSTKSYASNCP